MSEKQKNHCRIAPLTHGHSKGGKRSTEFEAFTHAQQRCINPNNKDWKDYGGRGIKFLFTSFEQFFAELGPKPKGLTLDRINTNGNYEPGNVRWATWDEQGVNRRRDPRTILTKDRVRAIRELWSTGLFSQSELAKDYGVTRSNIEAIVNNRIWRKQ